MKNKKIAILTTFHQWDEAYSLATVVKNQLKSLVKHDYPTVLFVLENFKDDEHVPEGVEVRKVIPKIFLTDYSQNQQLEDNFDSQVKSIQSALEENMGDIDIALTHDWIFQGWLLPHNVAMRNAAEKLKCKWFHWIHSAPSPRPDVKYPYDCRYKMMRNSKLIYMNYYDVIRLAEMYSGWADDVRVVHNPLDPRSFYDLHPLVSKLIDKYALLKADVIDVYPLSSTRFDGKQPDLVLKILAEMKKLGKDVRFVCPNAHANADKEKKAIENLIHQGIEMGLERKDIIFTSLEGKEYELGIPRRAVRDLFLLSNLFVFPTRSENCPLILLEAALSKNLLVLNDSFPALRDFFGKDALYFKFGSLVQQVKYEDRDRFYSDVAKIIIAELNKNKPMNAFTKLKQKYNFDYIFEQELEPLFYENDKQI